MPITEDELKDAALKLNQEIFHAVQVVSKTMAAITFPLKTKNELLELFTKIGTGDACEFETVTFTRIQAESYFPLRFFPIRDERDMLAKTYAALLHGKRMHQLSGELSLHKQFVDKDVL